MPDPAPLPVHVVVVDARRLVREGVCALLAADPRLRVDAAVSVSAAGCPDVLVVGEAPDDLAALATLGSAAGCPAVRLADVDPDVLADEVLAAAGAPPARRVEPRPMPASLSTRERGVLRLVARGLSAVEIGRELGISPRTVERHKQSVSAKLGAPNQTRAVALSLAAGRPAPASGRAG